MSWIIFAIIAVLVIYVISAYNSLVTIRNRADNSFSQIDTQLQRRFDLIPNLIETVKGYAAHEKEVFEKVTAARAGAMNANSVAEKAVAENELASTLKTLFAVAENYPALKANENFKELQVELTNTENKIAYARQFYNDTIQRYNTALQVFPKNIIANMFGFKEREYFMTDDDNARKAPKVQF